MKIYESSVRKPITTLLLFAGVILFGLYSFQRLPVDLYPEIDPPFITLFTSYQGANAADIEQNVTRVLEDNLNTVANLKRLTSKSQDNYSLVSLEFEWGTNLDDATNSIRDAISRMQRLLPKDVEAPLIFKFNTAMIPVLSFSITANESYAALRTILEDELVNPLNRIEGVGAISLSGGAKREIRVEVDPQRLEAHNLTVEQIGAAIQRENFNLPAGTLDMGNKSYPLRIEGELETSDLLRNLVVGQFNGRIIRLAEVARVNDSLADPTLIERRNGYPALRLSVQKQSGANTVKVAEEVLAMLPSLQKNLPPDVQIEEIYNTSEFIEQSIDSLAETVILAALFVTLVVLFFLGRWRATFIISITIPVSLIATFIYLFVSGNSINIISLSSLSIAIGMVVDDAIVVLENITSHLERGSSPREASIYGTNEVALAVVAATLTVIAVFFPLTMVQGLSGIMFRQLGWSVTIVIAISVMAALTLTPMLASRLLRSRGPRYGRSTNIAQRGIESILRWTDERYATTLSWVVRHRGLVIIGSIVVFVLSMLTLPLVRTEYMPESDNSRIKLVATLPTGVRVEYSGVLADRIEAAIRKHVPEIKLIASSYGAAGSENLFAALSGTGSNLISMDIRLVPPQERERSMHLISDVIRNLSKDFPEVEKLNVIPGGSNNGMGGAARIDVNVIGFDLDKTSTYADLLAEKMKAIPGTRDVDVKRDPYKMEFSITFDRTKLAEAGLNTTTAALFVRNRIYGLRAAKFREDGNEYDIVVRYEKPYRESLEDIQNITLYGSTGRPVKLSEVATIGQFYAPPTINRENRQRVVTVSCGMQKASLTDIVDGIERAIDQLNLPSDISTSIGGSAKDQQESTADLSLLLLLVVILVYIVMASQFESFKSPFIIMLSLPFSFSGVFLALLLTDESLNLVSMIGAIMLVGIVVKNGIVLVDFINLLRHRGYSTYRAIVEGGKSRLRPVLMTALTTVLGMLPLALSQGEGSEIWRPMGIAVIGGLTFSTLLTLVVIPAVYATFSATGLWMKLRKRRRQAHRMA